MTVAESRLRNWEWNRMKKGIISRIQSELWKERSEK